MEQSDLVNEIATALSKAQKEMGDPKKNKSVEIQTKSGAKISFDYADLGALRDCSRDALADNGLSISHGIFPLNEKLVLKTRLLHSSGQWISSIFPLSGAEDMKQFGGEITYAKRYNKSAILDLFADHDFDERETGGGGKKEKKDSKTAPKATRPPVPSVKSKVASNETPPPVDPLLVTEGQLKRLYARAAELGWKQAESKALVLSFGYQSSKLILKTDYDRIYSALDGSRPTIQSSTESAPSSQDNSK